MIRSVPAGQFAAVYPQIAHHFVEFLCLSRGGLQPGELERDVLDSKRQCFVIVGPDDETIRACCVTSISPSRKLTVEFCAGEGVEEWGKPLLAMFQGWAKELGGGLCIVGRKGWWRALDLPGEGFVETGRIYEWSRGDG